MNRLVCHILLIYCLKYVNLATLRMVWSWRLWHQPQSREAASMSFDPHLALHFSILERELARCFHGSSQHCSRVSLLLPVGNSSAHQAPILYINNILAVAYPAVPCAPISPASRPFRVIRLATIRQIELIAKHKTIATIVCLLCNFRCRFYKR